MRYWLIETLYRDTQDDLRSRVRIYVTPMLETAIDAVPDAEVVNRYEEIAEHDLELFDCEVVR